MSSEAHDEIVEFVQKAQALALVLLDPDPVRRLPGVWDVLSEVPTCSRDEDRVVLAVTIRRLAEAFVHAERPRELPPAARLRRARVSDLHAARVLECIRREFPNPRFGLQTAADKCRLSAPYLSHLLAVTTRHGFHTHLGGTRILHVAHLLVTTPLTIEEVADRSGFRSTSALDHAFKERFQMTPSEFRRWAAV